MLQHGQPIVVDFGITLAMRRAGGARKTQTGVRTGIPQNMSPERARDDRHIDGRADFHALEAVLVETLTGKVPHAGPTAQAVIARVVTIEVQSVIAIGHRRLHLHTRSYCGIRWPRALWRSRRSLRHRLRIRRGPRNATRWRKRRHTGLAPVVSDRSLQYCACRCRVHGGGVEIHRRLVCGGIERAREPQGTSSAAKRVLLADVTHTYDRLGMSPWLPSCLQRSNS